MNFDTPIDRNQFPTMKWSRDFLAEHFGNPDAIPMSVADMDFAAPPAVIEQLQKRATHGVYGYEFRPESFFESLEAWYESRHGWKINREHLEQTPSIMNAISILLDQHSNEGDGVILQTPVFFEFRMVIKSNGRRLIKNPLKLANGRYQIDFDDLREKTAVPTTKILILCNPHNPVGRVWTQDELAKIAAICAENDVFVISDEIHADFAFPPRKFVPYLTASDSAAQNGAACISPAKTFNISGMVDAFAVIPNDAHREQFHSFAHRYQINKTNLFTTAAVTAAFQAGADWLDALIAYLQGNVAFIREFLQANKMKVSLIEPEGTFLAWLDFRELGLDAKELEQKLSQEAAVALSPGYWYGREGAGFARMTIGCPRQTVQQALENMHTALQR
ncbi:MAG: pyridoxal phosphate-dependent aminotransferase [Anaerolineales bacterium]|nr:pyridoxal phosphate-dependent aminotransferase [Anaerolineales bacterium]